MKVKNVILVTALFIAMFFSCTANGQGVYMLGDHSPSLAYSSLSRTYRSVYLNYGSPFLGGVEINLWGNIYNGIGFLIGGVDDHSSPALAFDNVNDRFFMVWTRAWPYLDLYGLLMDYNSGEFLDPDQFLISSVPGIRAKPMVTRNSVNGGYLVTWLDERNIDGVAIYGQLITVDGELQGVEFMIASGLSWEYSDPSYSVAYDHVNQRFLVVWNTGEFIYGQFIDPNGGALEGEKFTIVEEPPDDYYPLGQTSLAYDGINQRYLVVWDVLLGTGSTFGQLVSANGTLVGTVFSISTWWSRNPSVAFDNINQRFLVAWTCCITDGQFVNADGTLQGERLPISHKGLWCSDDPPPAIAFNPQCGNFLVASVAKDNSEIKEIWATQSEINYTIVGDPCPAATMSVKKKGFRARKSGISSSSVACIKNKCTGKYLLGEVVSISASPGDNGMVGSWTGCDTVTNDICSITMDGDREVTVKFVRVPKGSR